MAATNSNSKLPALAFALLFTLFGLQGVRGAIKCEDLPLEMCAFSVSSTGARCLLEKSIMTDGGHQFQCQSSAVMAEKMLEWIESEECINVCGLERMWVGMSSDSLLETDFTSKLCSTRCQNSCPNIVDLYLNLAAGEGIDLKNLCEAQQRKSRRVIAEILSSAKSNGLSAESLVIAEAPSPSTVIY